MTTPLALKEMNFSRLSAEGRSRYEAKDRGRQRRSVNDGGGGECDWGGRARGWGGAGPLLIRCLATTAALSTLLSSCTALTLRPPARYGHTLAEDGGGSDRRTAADTARDSNPNHQAALSSHRKPPSSGGHGFTVDRDTDADTRRRNHNCCYHHHHHHHHRRRHQYHAYKSGSVHCTGNYHLCKESLVRQSEDVVGYKKRADVRRDLNPDWAQSSPPPPPPQRRAAASSSLPSLLPLTAAPAPNADQSAKSREETNSDSPPSRRPLQQPHSPQSRWRGLKYLHNPSSERSVEARGESTFASHRHRQQAELLGQTAAERPASRSDGKQAAAISSGTSAGNHATSTQHFPNNSASARKNTRKESLVEPVQIAEDKPSSSEAGQESTEDRTQSPGQHGTGRERAVDSLAQLLQWDAAPTLRSRPSTRPPAPPSTAGSTQLTYSQDTPATTRDRSWLHQRGAGSRHRVPQGHTLTRKASGLEGNKSPNGHPQAAGATIVILVSREDDAERDPGLASIGLSAAALGTGENQQQEPSHYPLSHSLGPGARPSGPHAANMVLTVLGSFGALAGLCLMAAIFQCCCRRRRRGDDEQDEAAVKKQQQQQQQQQQADEQQDGREQKDRSVSRSKSPSPQKVTVEETDEEDNEKRLIDQEDDEDLGDFSVVQRETEILRSYRKPPPPKNRARASRVPRALQTVSPNASPDVFQELIDQEKAENRLLSKESSPAPSRPAKGPATFDPMTASLISTCSMLADIDRTLMDMHTADITEDSIINKTNQTGKQSREGSAEKQLANTKTAVVAESPAKLSWKEGDDSNNVKISVKNRVAATENTSLGSLGNKSKDTKAEAPSPKLSAKSDSSPSELSIGQEEMAKRLEQELLKTAGKEGILKGKAGVRPPPRPVSPKPQRKMAAASPARDLKENGAVQQTAKDREGYNASSIEQPAKDREGPNSSSKESPAEPTAASYPNIFSLIDPTVKDSGAESSSKSRIPVRAASNPTQLEIPLRQSGRDKRFPVPSVHGEQLEQLMKSLKSRLKEDSGGPKRTTKVYPEDNTMTSDDNLQPQLRERSHSDPNQTREEKKNKATQQTHL